MNVHPATSAHGVVKRANHLLQHQTVLPTIASAISLIFTRCPRMRPPPQEEFCNEKSGETANEFPVIVRPLLMFPTAWACRRCRHNHFSPSEPTACRPARNAPSPSSTRPYKRSLNPSRPSSAGSSSPACPASWRTSRSPSAKRSCSAPFAIRSTARYRRSSWGKRKDDERHRSQARQRDAARRDPPKALKPARKRQMVDRTRSNWRLSIRRACRALPVERSTCQHRSRRPGQAELTERIKEIAATRVRYGYRAAAARRLAGKCQADLSPVSRDRAAIAQQNTQASGQ